MHAAILLILSLFLAGCNMEPRLQAPCMQIPCAWRVASDEGSTLCNLRWWESLADPVLDSLIGMALRNNYDLKVAVARVCEYCAKYQVASSPLFPQINLEGTALREKIPQKTLFAPATFNPYTPFYAYQFTLSYELDFWGKLRSQAHAAYAEALAAVEAKRTVILTLVSAVAEAYVTLRELDRELEIGYQTVAERAEYLRLARLRFEGGLTSEIEVTQATSLYDETLANVIQLEEQIPQQENLISVLVGQNPTCIARGRPITEFGISIEVPAGLPSELLLRRPDIIAAEDRLVAANAEIGAARAAFFPQIDLTGAFGGQSFQLKDLFTIPSSAWHIGVTFLQPIFTGWQLTGELKIAWARRQEALFSYQQTILNAFREVNDALVAFAQAKKLILAETDRVAATKEYLRLSWLRYYNGQNDYLTVLNAEQELFNSQIFLTQAQGDLYLSLIQLYKALGGGWILDAESLAFPFCR
jgi:outer membrane protein, multidrug efflux system